MDPNQFLQIHARPMKIHIDPMIASQADAPNTMMPWQGHKDVIIDRFDGRAHLDHIPDSIDNPNASSGQSEDKETREMNYERYRILCQNEYLKIGEEKFLKQLEMEEKFGKASTFQGKKAKEDKKKSAQSKAAIGFNYRVIIIEFHFLNLIYSNVFKVKPISMQTSSKGIVGLFL